jgi:hypothetical protein
MDWKKELNWIYDWWIKGEIKMAADNDPNSVWSWSSDATPDNLTWDDIKAAVKFLEDAPPYQPYTYIMGEQMAATLDKEIMEEMKKSVDVSVDVIVTTPLTVGWKADDDYQVFNQNWIDKAAGIDVSTWTPLEPLKAHWTPGKRDVDKFDYLLEGE